MMTMSDTPIIIHNNESSEYFFEEGCYIWELSNSSEDHGLSIARARVRPNTSTKLHRLENTVERYIILEGEGQVRLGNHSPQTVNAGDVIIIPQNCPQAISNSSHTEDLVFLVICTPRFIIDNYRDC
jgi:mannose-6-phosphate isomerase-like protein (cupin superfamily)